MVHIATTSALVGQAQAARTAAQGGSRRWALGAAAAAVSGAALFASQQQQRPVGLIGSSRLAPRR